VRSSRRRAVEIRQLDIDVPNPSEEHTIDDRDRPSEPSGDDDGAAHAPCSTTTSASRSPMAASPDPDGDDEVTAEPRDGACARPGRRRAGGRAPWDGQHGSTDLDRRLSGWFASAGADYVPQGLLDDVFSVTRSSRQRRGAIGRLVTAATDWWRAPVISRLVPQQVFYLVVVALLVVVAALAIASIGARRSAPPFGLRSQRLIAFDRDGAIVIARLDGTEISRSPPRRSARGPVYAPDGSRFAFTKPSTVRHHHGCPG
jgi:hypothetical protein